MRAGAFRRVPAIQGLYPKSKPPFLGVVLIICPDKEPMARELSIFVDESGDRGGKARYNMKELDEDEKSFEKLGITFEEKAFCDILVKVRNEHGFPYEEEKYLVLAKAIKEPVDDKAQYADWSTRDNIKKTSSTWTLPFCFIRTVIRRSGTKRYLRRSWNKLKTSRQNRTAASKR